MKKAIIIGAGISSLDKQFYFKEDINNNGVILNIINKYDKVIYFEYQDILDKHALIMKTLLDPARFALNQKAQVEILVRLESVIKLLQEEGYTVDLMAHSLFCWISAKARVKLNTVIHLGSPIGWQTPILRTIVRNDITPFYFTKPALTAINFYNFYSHNDIVGNRANIHDNKKWAFKSILNAEFNTGSTHDSSEYLKALQFNRHRIFKHD